MRRVTSPAARLVELLADARRAGEPFAVAWPAALQRALAGADDADAWCEALQATSEAWAAAWERRPTSRAQRALMAVADDPDRVMLDDDEPAEVCPECDAPLRRRGRGRIAIYCGPACRRSASAARVAARAA
jgi:hypothetical protein